MFDQELCVLESFDEKVFNPYFFDVYDVDLRNGLSFCVHPCLLCLNTNLLGFIT